MPTGIALRVPVPLGETSVRWDVTRCLCPGSGEQVDGKAQRDIVVSRIDVHHVVGPVRRWIEVPHFPDEVISYTRDDLLQALADALGSTADDPRIVDAYDQITSEWAASAIDPEAEYERFFRDGPIATRIDVVAATEWAKGRVLL
jgi:hypothetical protein